MLSLTWNWQSRLLSLDWPFSSTPCLSLAFDTSPRQSAAIRITKPVREPGYGFFHCSGERVPAFFLLEVDCGQSNTEPGPRC
jgi:hypothetical protein